MAIYIDTPVDSYSEQIVTFNKKSYILTFKYNPRFDNWSLSLFTSKREPLVLGESIQPNKKMLSRYGRNKDLQGYLYITSNSDDRVSKNNLGIDKEHTLTFASFKEIEDVLQV